MCYDGVDVIWRIPWGSTANQYNDVTTILTSETRWNRMPGANDTALVSVVRTAARVKLTANVSRHRKYQIPNRPFTLSPRLSSNRRSAAHFNDIEYLNQFLDEPRARTGQSRRECVEFVGLA